MTFKRFALVTALGFSWSLHDHNEILLKLSERVHGFVNVAVEDCNWLQKRLLDFGWWLQDTGKWLAEQGEHVEGWVDARIEDSGYTIEELTEALMRV